MTKIKDKDIRFKYILDNKDFFESGIFVNEYSIGDHNRVDFALLKDNYLYGYEIKSEADNLKRLEGQLRAYLKIFDYLYLIVYENHVKDVELLLNRYKLDRVGLIKVDKNLDFINIREAKPSTLVYRIRGFLYNLKREDLLDIAKELGIKTLRSNKDYLRSVLTGKIDVGKLVEKLKERLVKSHSHKCPHCGSNLVYSTSGIYQEVKKENNVLKKEKKVEVLRFKVHYKISCLKCIVCNKVFCKKIISVVKKELINKVNKKL